MSQNARQFAEKLLHIQAVKVQPDDPFTWASGWKSPIYCDNRQILSHPHIRDFVKSELANAVLEHFGEAEAIAGVATAGIPHGALAADLLRLPFVYVRSAPKAHGMGNQIEGNLSLGAKVVVVEDLVSTGKSSLDAVSALRAAGAEVIGMCALFTYGFDKAAQAFDEAKVPLVTISDYAALIELLASQNKISEQQVALLQSWRQAPESWGK